MPNVMRRLFLLPCLAATACGGPPAEADAAQPLIHAAGSATADDCPNGGVVFQVGVDRDDDGALDADEVTGFEVVCHGRDGSDGVDGANGSDGADGADGSDGAAGANGSDGENGADGADGSSCTVSANGDGTSTISCEDGTSVTISDGADGADGTNGVDGVDGTNGSDGVDGTNGSDGADGAPCTVELMCGGEARMVCPDGSSVSWSVGRTLGGEWTEATNDFGWSNRDFGLSGDVFGHVLSAHGRLYVIGGLAATTNERLRDVWTSEDGALWQQRTAAAEWPARYDHRAVAHGDQLFIVGGRAPMTNAYLEDVWASTDGAAWTEVNGATPWPAREDFELVSTGQYLLLFGGHPAGSGTPATDVWRSTDGATWTQVTTAVPWSARRFDDGYARYGHVLVKDGTVFVVGGIEDGTNVRLTDVWATDDGETWTELTADSGIGARYDHIGLVNGDELVILGGRATGTNAYLRDVWTSVDGVTWEQRTTDIGWTDRSFTSGDQRYGTVLSHAGRIYAVGGIAAGSNTRLQEVWVSDCGGLWSRATAAAGFGERYDAQVLSVDHKLVLFGGRQSGTNAYLREVWQSVD